MDELSKLKLHLNEVIERAENSARSADKALLKIKKAEKRINKAKLRIKAAEKIILTEQLLSEQKTDELLQKVINIADKANKKHKALKKLSKIKQEKISK